MGLRGQNRDPKKSKYPDVEDTQEWHHQKNPDLRTLHSQLRVSFEISLFRSHLNIYYPLKLDKRWVEHFEYLLEIM